MKIKCLNCKSAYVLVALKGQKVAPGDEKKVVTRCPVCCDVLAYTLHEVPTDEPGKDRLRLIVLHDHLWPRASTLCALGRKDTKKMLICTGCPHAGVIDAKFCDTAKAYNELLLKPQPGDEPPEDDIDEPQSPLSAPITDFYMPEDDA